MRLTAFSGVVVIVVPGSRLHFAPYICRRAGALAHVTSLSVFHPHCCAGLINIAQGGTSTPGGELAQTLSEPRTHARKRTDARTHKRTHSRTHARTHKRIHSVTVHYKEGGSEESQTLRDSYCMEKHF